MIGPATGTNDEVRFAFTIDVEDWFNSSRDLFAETDSKQAHAPDPSVVGNTRACLAALGAADNRATFFILTPVAEHYPDLIREILDQGHEIAVHGYRHSLVYNLTPAEFRADLEKSLDLLAKAGAGEIIGYRAPYWSITRKSLWALEVLREFGFRYDSSIFPIRRGLYGIPDAPRWPHEIADGFWEFPPSTHRWLGVNVPIAGGGYLRLLPNWFVEPLIRKMEDSRQHGVFYCHPYELDPDDVRPKVKLRKAASLVYYAQQIMGRKDNPRRLRELMTRHRFTTLRSILEQVTREASS